MIEICAVASGSNGNCYYIGSSESAILVDAGISCKQVFTRMAARGLDMAKVKAVFVSHEHADHCCGIRALSKKTGLPVYLTSKTNNRIREDRRSAVTQLFAPGDAITVDGFTIHTFLKNHDAAEPCSFRIEYEGVSAGVFTDIGHPCNRVKHHLEQCHALFLETNYDEEMLRTGTYPYYLKERIASGHGHLSNLQALELLKNHHHPALQAVILSHLSAENNCPEAVTATFREMKTLFRIEIAGRHAAGGVHAIRS